MYNNGLERDNQSKEKVFKPRQQTEKNPENSFRLLWENFASDTSFGGLSKATLSNGWLRRCIWALISATCYGFTIYMCYTLVVSYMNKPISTAVDIIYEKNIDFPSVTVCNLNQFRKSKLRKIPGIGIFLTGFGNRSKNGTSDFDKSFNKQTASLKKGASINSDIDDEENSLNDVDFDETIILQELVAIKAADYSEKKLMAVGHQYKRLFLKCLWMGLNCKNGYLAKFWTASWNWKFGNCYTFNPGANETGHSVRILRTSMPGPNYGLSMDFNIEQSEYVNELVDEAGLKIIIHNPKQIPFPYDEGITVPPGYSTSLAIRKETIIRVDPFKNGSCFSSQEIDRNNIYRNTKQRGLAKYSVKACMKSCLAMEQNRVCNCSGTQFSQLTNICTEEDEIECLAVVSSKYREGTIGCSKKCPQPCLHQSYRYSIMMAALTVNAKEVLKKDDFGDENKTDDDISNNFLRVNVFYEELNLQKVVQSTPYGLDNLLGDIGGQLGLWVGICVISVAEFGELLMSLCAVVAQKSRDRKKTKTSEMELT